MWSQPPQPTRPAVVCPGQCRQLFQRCAVHLGKIAASPWPFVQRQHALAIAQHPRTQTEPAPRLPRSLHAFRYLEAAYFPPAPAANPGRLATASFPRHVPFASSLRHLSKQQSRLPASVSHPSWPPARDEDRKAAFSAFAALEAAGLPQTQHHCHPVFSRLLTESAVAVVLVVRTISRAAPSLACLASRPRQHAPFVGRQPVLFAACPALPGMILEHAAVHEQRSALLHSSCQLPPCPPEIRCQLPLQPQPPRTPLQLLVSSAPPRSVDAVSL